MSSTQVSATTKPPIPAPAYVLEAYAERAQQIKQRLGDFREVARDAWFYELCFCLCTPQSKAAHAALVIKRLEEADFRNKPFDPTSILRDRQHYIRFHNTKAKRLQWLQQNFAEIEQGLISSTSARDARSYLVKQVKGVGMKEASHFLRNIGYRGIAIIDRHILKHLHRCGVLSTADAPTSVRRYEEIEQQWKQFASDIRIDMDELDLVFWSLETGEIIK